MQYAYTIYMPDDAPTASLDQDTHGRLMTSFFPIGVVFKKPYFSLATCISGHASFPMSGYTAFSMQGKLKHVWDLLPKSFLSDNPE